MFPILSIITFLPLLGGIVILFFPKTQLSAIRWTALGIAWMNLLLAIVLMLVYLQANATAGGTTVGNAPSSTFLFNEYVPWVSALGINYSLGVDGISLLLVVLTTLLTVVCIGASFHIEQKTKNYMAFMLLLECGIIGVFLATNLFLFYIFWELMLIPAYFLVGSWGGERRIYAAIKFVLYTSVGSLLMLAGIIALGYYHQQAVGGSYTLDLTALLNTKLSSGIQLWLLLAFAAAFAVKIPFVPFHSWLPDAYSEAPAPVTVMLAGAMSKTGAYGFLRFCLPLFPNAVQTLAPLFNTLAVVGILYCALLALVQTDMKRLLAYSSISHLGVVMLGMFAFNTQAVIGGAWSVPQQRHIWHIGDHRHHPCRVVSHTFLPGSNGRITPGGKRCRCCRTQGYIERYTPGRVSSVVAAAAINLLHRSAASASHIFDGAIDSQHITKYCQRFFH